VRGINIFDLKRARVPVPPPAEQDAIADYLDRAMAALDDLRSEAENAIVLLQERRSALISAAVTGKIDVRAVAPAEAEAA
jgi:type I restriction enzyme S subunit